MADSNTRPERVTLYVCAQCRRTECDCPRLKGGVVTGFVPIECVRLAPLLAWLDERIEKYEKIANSRGVWATQADDAASKATALRSVREHLAS